MRHEIITTGVLWPLSPKIVLPMKKIFKVLGVLVVSIIAIIGMMLLYVTKALPNVDPAPDIQIEHTTERIERGRYLANTVMGCTHCHSPQNKTQFAHPIKEDMLGAGGNLFGTKEGFPGNYYAPNITPENLAEWTDGEIYRALTAGVSKDGRALFPIMPYQRFALAEDEDLYSIISYIRTLEPVKYQVPPSESFFPMNFIINTIPSTPSPAPPIDRADPVSRGKNLVQLASCIDCHTQKKNGADLPGMTFAGGMEFQMEDGSIVRSANITPDLEMGIGTWTEEQFVNRFRIYADPDFEFHEVGDGEFNTAMPWGVFSKMSEGELKAIYAYLRTVEPVKNSVVKFSSILATSSD